MSPLERATIAAFNATATEEQKRIRDAIAEAYADVPPAAPPPFVPPRTGYGSVKEAVIADLRANPRSTSTEVAKRIGVNSANVAELGGRGAILREPSGRTSNGGQPVYLYSAKEPA